MLLQNREGCFLNEGLRGIARESDGRYRYKVFGLRVASDMELPELLPEINPHGTPEVQIRFGQVPAESIGVMAKNRNYQATEDQFLMQVPGVGRYHVTKGNSILIEPAVQAEDRFVRLFLLGTVFGTLLMQRRIVPIHGSAVIINGCGVIFTGESGAGKSTLLAAFRERGYPYLTDDVAAVKISADGVPWVLPAYPQQKLWRDSAETVGVDVASLTPIYIFADKDKFAVPAHKGFCSSPVPLAAVYKLEAERRQDVSLRSITGMDKLTVLLNHTYRLELFEGLGLKAAHLKHCAAIAGQAAVAFLLRPEGEFSLGEQIRLVEQDVARRLAHKAV